MPVQIGFILVYLTLAFYAARWNRGVLPVAAALAVLLADLRARRRPGVVRARQDAASPSPRSARACSGC